jgi:hypothetical protein
MTICEVPQASQALISPVLAGVLGMLALIMVSLRLAQRTAFKRLFGLDDAFIVAALVCAVPLNCTMFPSQSISMFFIWFSTNTKTSIVHKFGLGTNIWTIPFDHITKELEVIDLLSRSKLLLNLHPVTIRRRSLLYGRWGSNSTILPRLLFTHLPNRTIQNNMLLSHDPISLLRCIEYLRHDLSMHTCSFLLVRLDGWVQGYLY